MRTITGVRPASEIACVNVLPPAICAHSFRGAGIIEYVRNGGDLEIAARTAGHGSTRTTQLYNQLHEEISLDEIECIHI